MRKNICNLSGRSPLLKIFNMQEEYEMQRERDDFSFLLPTPRSAMHLSFVATAPTSGVGGGIVGEMCRAMTFRPFESDGRFRLHSKRHILKP